MLCVAQPPQGVSAASLVASALSRALGSPLRLPLEPLLTCNPDSLPRLQHTLFGAGNGQSEHMTCQSHTVALRQCNTYTPCLNQSAFLQALYMPILDNVRCSPLQLLSRAADT